jgi:DMSO reductase anchor subunit
LVIMLVLTQLSVGTYLFLPDAKLALFSLIACAVALVVSTLHLGRPQFAFRAILGIGHSWLSREIVAFGGFAKFAALYTATLWIPMLDIPILRYAAAGGMIIAGLSGVFCSAMLYHVTAKPSWRLPLSGGKFLFTTVLLGSAAAGAWPLANLAGIGKLFCELRTFQTCADSATLMLGPLRRVTTARFAIFAIGLLLLPFATWPALALLIAGQLCERYLFFTCIAAPKMPGEALP